MAAVFTMIIVLLLFATSYGNSGGRIIIITFSPRAACALEAASCAARFSSSKVAHCHTVTGRFLGFSGTGRPFSCFPRNVCIRGFSALFGVRTDLGTSATCGCRGGKL